MEYNSKFGHNLGWIHQISIMSRIDICYTACGLGTQTVSPTLPSFQGIKRCIKYMASHPNKPIFILILIMMAQMLSDLHGVGINLKTTQPRNFYNAIKTRIMIKLLTK